MNVLLESFKYATGAPYFWGSMGFTAAIAVFVGAAIFDGHLDQIKKALMAVLSYGGMLFWVSIVRVMSNLGLFETPVRPVGNIVALGVTTFSWVFGVLIGIFIFRYKYKN